MPIAPIISILGDAFAVLCVVAIIPWILGVPGDPGPPGHESHYARGWTMGLVVICVYPVVRIVAVAAVCGARFFAGAAMQARVENIGVQFGAAVFLLALLRLAWALRILSKK